MRAIIRNKLMLAERMMDCVRSQYEQIGNVQDSSKHFREEYFVDVNHFINNCVFIDRGREVLYKDYEQCMRDLPSEYFSCSVSDPLNDHVIKDMIRSLRLTHEPIDSEFYEDRSVMNDETLELGRHLIRRVSDFFGGLSDPSIGKRCDERIKQIQQGPKPFNRKNMTNIIHLGKLKGCGLCRHRSILFKLLCDEFGIKCRILRGWLEYKGKSEAHMWNEVVLEIPGKKRYTVDCMNFSTFVNESPFAAGVRYKNLGHPIDKLRFDEETVKKIRKSYPNVISKKKLECLDRGGFGTVYSLPNCEVVTGNSKEGFHTKRKDLVIKEINLSTFCRGAPANKQAVMKEIEYMRLLHHPNNPVTVKIYGYFMSTNKFTDEIINIIMDKHEMNGLRFSDILEKNLNGSLSKEKKLVEIAILLLGITKGLSYIHSYGLVHFDIKLQNILIDLDENGLLSDVRITDFGSCKQSNLHCMMTTIPALSILSAPPEVRQLIVQHSLLFSPLHSLRGRNGKKVNEMMNIPTKFSTKSDIFSFGIILDQLRSQLKGEQLTESEYVQYVELEERCLDSDPSKRPSIGEVRETILGWIKKYLIQAAETFYSYGSSLFKQNKSLESKKEALSMLEKCSEIRRFFLGENDLLTSNSYYSVGNVRLSLGDILGATKSLEKCLAIRKFHFVNENHESVVRCLDKMGDVIKTRLFNMSKKKKSIGINERQKKVGERAILCYQEALRMRKGLKGVEDEYVSKIRFKLSQVYERIDEWRMCFAHRIVFLKVKEKLISSDPNHQHKNEYLGRIYFESAEIGRKIGDREKAMEYFLKSMEIWEGVNPIKHKKRIFNCCRSLGEIELEKGRIKSAIPYFKNALQLSFSKYRRTKEYTGISKVLGELFEKKLKMYDTALIYYSRAGTEGIIPKISLEGKIRRMKIEEGIASQERKRMKKKNKKKNKVKAKKK